MQYALDDSNNDEDSIHLTAVDNGGGSEVGSLASASLSRASSRLFRKKTGSPELKAPLTDLESQESDPFYVFREDLYRKLDLVDEGLAEYLRIVQQTDTSVNTYALKDAKKQLKRHIRNAESTLKDVSMAVNAVENQRDKFAHIDNTELYDRRTLVTTSKERIAKAKADMHSDNVKAKLLADEKAKAIRRAQQSGDSDTNGVQNFEIDSVADSQAQTSLLMQEQDETLDELGEAVTRVGSMADNIHQELGMQSRIMSEMEDDLADAEEKLGLVMGKLGKFLKTKNKWQLRSILILTLIVIVLFFLVLYT